MHSDSAPILPTIDMIGNAHLDPAWMWQWGEGMEAFIATCRSALDRMDETPGFIFTCSSAAHYAWVERAEPELFERIRQRVAEGRWAITGGWWVQADCNLPSGEGFARQALLGQRYFQSRFGRRARTGYSPDAFGHAVGLPQLLARSGMTGYIFCRPDPTELQLPSPLVRWRGPDGSSVLAYRVPFHYNMYETSVPKKVRDLVGAWRAGSALTDGTRPLADIATRWTLFYGVGNHGGGPTREQIAQILAIDADPAQPALHFSDPDRALAAMAASAGPAGIPEWSTDLQLNAPGCYSAHAAIKRLNRSAEHRLTAAERVDTLAHLLLGTPISTEELTRAWTGVCFNHFHDILCGVAIREALEDAVALYGEALTIADRTLAFAVQRLARGIDTSGPGETVMVMNPHAWDEARNVTVELWHDIDKALWSEPVHVRVTDDDGREVAAQTGFTSGKIGRDRVAITFRAEAPALGWRCYRLHYGEVSSLPEPAPIAVAPTTLENACLRVEVDPVGGTLASIIDKRDGRELLCGAGAAGIVIDDPTDTWGHGVERFDTVVGRFGDADVRIVENGPTRATIRSRSRWGASWLQQDFRLDRDATELHVRVTVFWAEERRMLKLAFPAAAHDGRAWYESAYAAIGRACDGIERPGGSWCAVVGGEPDGGTHGLLIANDAKHGYSAQAHGDGAGATIMLTALRSPSYATHDPHPFHPDEDLEFMEQGIDRFAYTLEPVVGAQWRARAHRAAALVNVPLIRHLESQHEAAAGRPLERGYRGIDISPAHVVATVLKEAEDGSGLVLRLYETIGTACRCVIHLHAAGRRFETEIGAASVLTLLVRSDTVTEIDLAEFPAD